MRNANANTRRYMCVNYCNTNGQFFIFLHLCLHLQFTHVKWGVGNASANTKYMSASFTILNRDFDCACSCIARVNQAWKPDLWPTADFSSPVLLFKQSSVWIKLVIHVHHGLKRVKQYSYERMCFGWNLVIAVHVYLFLLLNFRTLLCLTLTPPSSLLVGSVNTLHFPSCIREL